MKNTIRNLIFALPLATAAFTLVPAAAAQAEVGPIIVLPPHTDPEPGPLDLAPAPKPEPPKDIAIPTPKPEAPKDIAIPKPKPDKPKGPGDLTNPEPCPTHGVDCTPGEDEPNDGNDDGDDGGDSSDEVFDSFAVPSRIDAGLASEEQGGMDLTWLLVGGAVVTASGAGFAARTRLRRSA